MTMETQPFEDVSPIKHGHFPLSRYLERIFCNWFLVFSNWLLGLSSWLLEKTVKEADPRHNYYVYIYIYVYLVYVSNVLLH